MGLAAFIIFIIFIRPSSVVRFPTLTFWPRVALKNNVGMPCEIVVRENVPCKSNQKSVSNCTHHSFVIAIFGWLHCGS